MNGLDLVSAYLRSPQLVRLTLCLDLGLWTLTTGGEVETVVC